MTPPDAIAVVGLAGRFPGSPHPGDLHHALSMSCLLTRHLDASGELLWARGLLHRYQDFDPGFFGMPTREALVADPQHRLLLECAWEALADAGTPPGSHDTARRTAVFVGVNHSGYRELLQQAGHPPISAVEFESGTDKDFAATRISYRLRLQGPAMTVQTACSTSLVAIHLACQSLLEFESDQAIAGGASLVLPEAAGWAYEPRVLHSADGICRPFDAEANGTVMGDGAGVVVLRRLEDAIADGSRIHAVIRGTAVNNDGGRKAGYATPSAAGQEEVIRAAQLRAGLSPHEIGYVETHGTGTALGDGVELRALTNVFAGSDTPCVLGSGKGAIGHLDTAAGVVGLIRCCLALEQKVLPGTVNHTKPNADLEAGSFSVLAKPEPWHCDTTRRAGVSSFGVGGTNAHAVLEEYRRSQGARSTTSPLAAAGYRPRRVWPNSSYGRETDTADRRTSHVELLEARWCEVARAAADGPGYGEAVLLADRDLVSEALHGHLVASGVSTTRMTPADLADGALPAPTSRALLVSALDLTRTEDRRAYDALTVLARRRLGTQRGGLDVVLVTRGVYSPLGDERGDPALATLTGLARVLTMETPALRIRVVDLQDTSERSLRWLSEELLTWRAEPIIAQRGRRWWGLRYEQTTIASGGITRRDASAVSVVIGSGQLGGAAARALARIGQTVVIVAKPGRADTTQRLAAEWADPNGTVIVEECDARYADQLHALLDRLEERHGAIDQLVHAAGISGDAAYQDSTDLPPWHEEPHFRVKIDGIAALGAALTRHRVRRVVLTSSLAGTLGGLSLGPYAAAAAAMDAFADRFDGPTTRWLSVGWDAWWRHDPMTAIEARMTESGLSPDEGDAAMYTVLSSDLSGRVLLSKGDFQCRWDRYVAEPLRAAKVPTPGSEATGRSDDILGLLLRSWQTHLSESSIRVDDDLMNAGADSITWLDVLSDVEPVMGFKIPEGLFFEAPTPRLLAERIGQLRAGATVEQVSVEQVREWGHHGAPVWCLHPIGGSADAFAVLAGALGGHLVRAVSGVPLADLEAFETVESIADRYLALLRGAAWPSVLVGWSFGGVIAFRLAQAVAAATGWTPPLVILDIPAPGVRSGRTITEVDDAEILAAIISHRAREKGSIAEVGGWDNSYSDDRFAGFVERLRSRRLLPPGFTAERGQRMATGYRHRITAMERFRPHPHAGRMTLITAREAEFGGTEILHDVFQAPPEDPTWGWQSLSRDTVAVRTVDGHHATLLQPPAVQEVAAVIRSVIPSTDTT